jgi:L-ascorbate metabolism protein UlaG (beta-lactamase superfamily)
MVQKSFLTHSSPRNPLASGIDLNALKCDYVFVSHGHFDHVVDVETIARNNNAMVVANYEIATYFGEKKLRYHPMNVGGQWDFGQFKVKSCQCGSQQCASRWHIRRHADRFYC